MATHSSILAWRIPMDKEPGELQSMGSQKSQTWLSNYPTTTREGDGTPLQYSCLENPMDGGAWWATVHGVAKSWTRLSDFTFTFHFHALEKEMATHSSIIAWRIPGMGEPGGLPSMGSHRVGHDWSNLAAAAPPPTTKHFINLFAHTLPTGGKVALIILIFDNPIQIK